MSAALGLALAWAVLGGAWGRFAGPRLSVATPLLLVMPFALAPTPQAALAAGMGALGVLAGRGLRA